jgi:hypothetical protein
VGHLGGQKTTEYVRKQFWWDGIGVDVAKFCTTCHICQSTKLENKKPAGLLHSLPIPSQPWESIAMDFLGPFPKSELFDYLWVVVCRLTGMVHLIPCTTRSCALDLAVLYMRDVVRLHGVPKSIVSDRDLKFTSKFWSELHRLLGSKLLMLTVFYPQTDGLTKQTNCSISQILRTMIQPDQTDWALKLLLVEFALNSCKSETMQFSPFELNYGFVPTSLSNFMLTGSAVGVQHFAEHAHSCLEDAHDAIIATRVKQAHYANQGRSDHKEFKVDDLVYLSTENLQLPSHRAKKLAPKFIGPFRIAEVHNKASVVRLDLPDELTKREIHPKFHASNIRPYRANDNDRFPNRTPVTFYDFGVGDAVNAEESVDEIVSHYWENGEVMFLVRWTLGSSSWEPWSVVKDLEAID